MNQKIKGRGAAILTDGNSVEVKTGAWKNKEPVYFKEKCKQCMFCVSYCPEGCIYQKDGILTKFDMDYCKGCGVCAKVCPFGAIAMQEVKERGKKDGN